MPTGFMFAKLATSVAIGFVGAYPLAVSSGLMGTQWGSHPIEQQEITIASGIILFILALALIGPTLRLVHQVIDALGRIEERPRPAIAWTMLVLGTLASMSAPCIALTATNRPPTGLTMNMPGFNAGPAVAMESSGSFALGVLTILTFLLGASLTGLAIWASLNPSRRAVGRLSKPDVREFDEVAA